MTVQRQLLLPVTTIRIAGFGSHAGEEWSVASAPSDVVIRYRNFPYDLGNVVCYTYDMEQGQRLSPATEPKAYFCEVCHLRIGNRRVIVAESRGKIPRYDCTTCRRTAEKRRARAAAVAIVKTPSGGSVVTLPPEGGG